MTTAVLYAFDSMRLRANTLVSMHARTIRNKKLDHGGRSTKNNNFSRDSGTVTFAVNPQAFQSSWQSRSAITAREELCPESRETPDSELMYFVEQRPATNFLRFVLMQLFIICLLLVLCERG